MKIIFTKHALGKFKHYSIVKLGIKKKHIELALKSPDYPSKVEGYGVKSILKKYDAVHDLRVIYREDNDIIIVITFHPAERGRYEKS